MKGYFSLIPRRLSTPLHTCRGGVVGLLLLLFLLALTACEDETYKTGDGRYSYLCADFGEVMTGESMQLLGGITDEGKSMAFSHPYTAQWATTPDSTYRALIYYYLLDDNRATPYSISRVPVMKPYETQRPDTLSYDPLVFESTWVSKNGKYLNLGFYVKTGQADGIDGTQRLGFVQEGVTTQPDGSRMLTLRVYHDQMGVPEYYSAHGFVSVPLLDIYVDQITLHIPTYDGWTSRTLTIE